jgi:hypothetical protein
MGPRSPANVVFIVILTLLFAAGVYETYNMFLGVVS